MTTQQDEWLPLSAAADRLNVHPTTLRRWADQGDIPVMLTPGGHRRFSAADLEAFAQERHGRQPQAEEIRSQWAENALTHTRQEITEHADVHWLARLDDETRREHRHLGQQLMGLTLQYVSADNGEGLLQEAHRLGQRYALTARQVGMPLAETLQAAFFFRDQLVETAIQSPAGAYMRTEDNLRLLRRINTLLNTVQLAIADSYDSG
jgi:excisionase family DNA binding protein